MLNTLSPVFTLLDAKPGQYSGVVSALLIARIVFGVLPYGMAVLVGVLCAVLTRSLWWSWVAAGTAFCVTGVLGLMVSALSVGGF
jgi:hypothetical protein